MTLQDMTDKDFQDIVSETQDIQYLIIKSGGMATKSKVEDTLMERYGLDRGDAHTITNYVEGQPQAFRIGGGVKWIAKREEPR